MRLDESSKHILDFLALIAGASSFFFTTVVPALAGLCGLVWYGIRFYEYYKSKKSGNIKFL